MWCTLSRPCILACPCDYSWCTCWPLMTILDSTSQWRFGLISRDCPFFTVEVKQDFTCSVNVVDARPTCFLVWVLACARFIDRWISAVILSTICWYSDFLSTIFYCDTVADFMLVFAIGMLLTYIEWGMEDITTEFFDARRLCYHGCWLICNYVFVPLWLFCSIFGCPRVILIFSYMLYKLI